MLQSEDVCIYMGKCDQTIDSASIALVFFLFSPLASYVFSVLVVQVVFLCFGCLIGRVRLVLLGYLFKVRFELFSLLPGTGACLQVSWIYLMS